MLPRREHLLHFSQPLGDRSDVARSRVFRNLAAPPSPTLILEIGNRTVEHPRRARSGTFVLDEVAHLAAIRRSHM